MCELIESFQFAPFSTMPFAEHNDSPIYCHHGSPHIFEPESISVSPPSEDSSEFNPEIQDASAPQWTVDFRNDEAMDDHTMEDDQYNGEHPCEQSQFSGNFRWDRPLTDKCLEGISLPDWTQTMFKRRIGGDRPSTSEIEQQTREMITAKRRRNSPEYHQTSYGNVKRVEADSSVLDSELEMSNVIEQTPEESSHQIFLNSPQSSQIDSRSPFFSR